MSLSGGKTITFSGTGVYVFNAIANSGTFNTFVFDFGNSPTGHMRIYVHGDVDMGKMNVEFVNGGDASRVYTEIHGKGTNSSNPTFAFSLTSGASGTKFSEWQGTVYAPYASIRVGSGASSSKVIGALWSGTQVVLGSNVTVSYQPLQPCILSGTCDQAARLQAAAASPAAAPLQLYPNPVKDRLTISMKGASLAEAEVQVTDMLGRIYAVRAQHTNGMVVLDLAALNKGLYVVSVNGEAGNQLFRILKE